MAVVAQLSKSECFDLQMKLWPWGLDIASDYSLRLKHDPQQHIEVVATWALAESMFDPYWPPKELSQDRYTSVFSESWLFMPLHNSMKICVVKQNAPQHPFALRQLYTAYTTVVNRHWHGDVQIGKPSVKNEFVFACLYFWTLLDPMPKCPVLCPTQHTVALLGPGSHKTCGSDSNLCLRSITCQNFIPKDVEKLAPPASLAFLPLHHFQIHRKLKCSTRFSWKGCKTSRNK